MGEDDKKMCRICLGFEGEDDADLGPMISPCLCKGTSKYVHAGCLQQWRTGAGGSVNFYECSACHYKYRLSRAPLAHFLLSKTFRVVLTVTLLITSIYLLGFIARPFLLYFFAPEEINSIANLPLRIIGLKSAKSAPRAAANSFELPFADSWGFQQQTFQIGGQTVYVQVGSVFPPVITLGWALISSILDAFTGLFRTSESAGSATRAESIPAASDGIIAGNTLAEHLVLGAMALSVFGIGRFAFGALGIDLLRPARLRRRMNMNGYQNSGYIVFFFLLLVVGFGRVVAMIWGYSETVSRKITRIAVKGIMEDVPLNIDDDGKGVKQE